MSKYKMMNGLQRVYVSTMMAVVGRGLVAISKVDDEVRQEIAGFPEGYIIQMVVLPGGPGFIARVKAGGELELAKGNVTPDLSIKFKHLKHAFLVFSFQEGTAKAFANDRMIADGEVSHAIRLVRCLNKMEAIILPKLIAKLAVKRYPGNLGTGEKISKAARIYALVTKNFLTGS